MSNLLPGNFVRSPMGKSMGFIVVMVLILFYSVSLYAQEPFSSESSTRLYYPLFGPKISFSELDLIKIAENFDVSVGYLPTRDELAYIRGINPEFQALQYKASWTNSIVRKDYPDPQFEQKLNNAMLYYRAGILEGAIGVEQTRLKVNSREGVIVPGTAHRDSLHSYSESGVKKYPHVLRIENEIMKVLEADGDSVTVIRGIWGSTPQSHPAGSNVLSPTYVTNPNTTSPSFGYHLDPAHPIRWHALASECIEDMRDRDADGIWIDILGSSTLRATRMDGVITFSYWDRETDTEYTSEEFRKESEQGITIIQDSVFKVLNRYPVIWGNNMTAFTFMDGINDRYKFLVPTPEKPRPIDGYCIEDAWGGYTPEQWIRFNEHDEIIIPAKAKPGEQNYRNWEMNLEEVMVCAQEGWAAAPQMINGGMKNQAFEYLDDSLQHDWYLWAYSSYLMAVEIPDTGKISTFQGITAARLRNGIREVNIDPCLQWKIGVPIESQAPGDSENYKITGNTYARQFSNGIVLVNPSLNDDPETIDLTQHGGPYIDPETGKAVSLISQKKQTGRILLKQYDPSDYTDYDEVILPYSGEPYFGRPFSVPGEDSIRMTWFDKGGTFRSIRDSDEWDIKNYLPNTRTDDLDKFPYVEMYGDPPGIFYVSNGDTWSYSVDLTARGAYGVILYYSGDPSEQRERSIRLSIYNRSTREKLYEKTNAFLFASDLPKPPQEYGGISLKEGSYIFEWKGLYTGAKPNLDYFKIYFLYPDKPARERIETVKIYPTIARTFLHVESELPGQLHVVDLSGRVLLSREIEKKREEVDISSLSAGSYQIVIKNRSAVTSHYFFKPD